MNNSIAEYIFKKEVYLIFLCVLQWSVTLALSLWMGLHRGYQIFPCAQLKNSSWWYILGLCWVKWDKQDVKSWLKSKIFCVLGAESTGISSRVRFYEKAQLKRKKNIIIRTVCGTLAFTCSKLSGKILIFLTCIADFSQKLLFLCPDSLSLLTKLY